MRNRKKIAVIGGGAAGMMAAICAAGKGASVTVIEKNTRLGKKLGQTGNGRCNYTNLTWERSERYYRSSDPSFPYAVLERFSPEEAIAFFQTLGIFPKYRGSYVYPNSDQAASFVSAMEWELKRLSVRILSGTRVTELQRRNGASLPWCVSLGQREPSEEKNRDKKKGKSPEKKKGGKAQAEAERFWEECFDAVILATGSKAFPNTGSDGEGYHFASNLGHAMVPVVPSLTGLRCREAYFSDLAGVRTEAELRLMLSGAERYRERGELQLTDYGLSGIPVFQFARFAAYGLQEGEKVQVLVDFTPDLTEESLYAYLCQRKEELKDRALKDFLEGFLNQKLAKVLLKQSFFVGERLVGSLKKEELLQLVKVMKGLCTNVETVNSFAAAQCCAGGVDPRSVQRDSLESTLQKGLYFAGEILDVDGICGGYNLQFAWASGKLAGEAAAE